MTYQVFCQVFSAGSWKWTSKDPASVGMRLDGAFRAFAVTVNALPGNADTPLSVIRSHADANATRWGYTWQLGHPIEPAHLWFHVESPTTSGATLQGESQTYSSGQFGSAKASTFSNNTSNGGYGAYSNSVANSAGLAYIDSTITGATSIGAILLIAQDTTPGREFFCWTLKTTGGNDELHRDCCHALYKSPGTTGWCSLAVFPRTSRQSYETVALHGYSGNRFGSLPPSISASLHSNGHQLRSGIAIGHYDLVLDPQGLLDSPPPLIQLPAPLFIGSTTIRGASTHFGKVTRPDGVMLQLGQRSLAHDIWLWLPSGTSHSQVSPWMSVFALSYWRECNELHFISGLPLGGLPPQGIQLITGTADFIRNFPPMSAAGTNQHPQQGPLLSSSGSEGDGGDGSGALSRPTTGLLWPRGV
ncbi:MAG: hypothetical protein NTW51_05525 [Cyanobacteria bacterium]|nr:hypothetical protein [Cyanobacteriota bacterium]